ncbi:MAG: hypothetical protein IT266_12005 [Saprospiraceae bacterium]|nr:hypothetical protein [Saprospiraceae bacterium]
MRSLRLLLPLAAIAAWCALLNDSWAFEAAEWRQQAWVVAAVAILVPLNVAFEAAKLQALCSAGGRFWKYFMHTCRGIALQSIVPLGAGTYAGRALGAPPSKRKSLLAATFAGGIMQTLCAALGFFVVILVFNGACFPWLQTEGLLQSLLLTCSALGAIGLVAVGIGQSDRAVASKIMGGWREAFGWPAIALAKAAGWSLLRYLVYFAQMAMLLSVFSARDAGCTLVAVSAYYLLVSVVVLPTGMGLAVRGGIAPFVFGPIGLDAGLSAAVAMLIFLLNNLLPAILGVFFLLPKTPEAAK